jgi:hypothetical protein
MCLLIKIQPGQMTSGIAPFHTVHSGSSQAQRMQHMINPSNIPPRDHCHSTTRYRSQPVENHQDRGGDARLPRV